MSYTVEVNDKRIPMLSSSSIEWSAGEDGKHRTSSMTAVIRDPETAAYLLTHEGLIDAVIRDGEEVIFTGVVRSYVSINAQYGYQDEITLEVLDYTEKMHIKVLQKVDGVSEGACIFSEILDGYRVCVSSGDSLIHTLCRKAGIEIGLVPEILTKIERYELKAGEYLDTALATLLYEYLYDFRFDPFGKLVIYSTDPDTVPSKTLSSGLYNNVSIEKRDDPKDGFIISFDKYLTYKDLLIGEWSTSAFTLAILGGYDSGFMDRASQTVIWDFSALGGNQKAVRISDLWATGWTSGPISGSLSVTIDEYSQDQGKISVYGGGWYYAGEIRWGAKIYADATYLYPEKSSVGYTGLDTESYTASCIQSTEGAIKLVEALKKRSYSKSVSFSSFERIDVGSFIRLSESQILGISSKVRITSVSYDPITHLYSYRGETIGDISIDPPDISTEKPDAEAPDLGDFFKIVADRTQLIQEEDGGEIHISSSGYGLDKYSLKVSFFLNSYSISSEDGRTVTITKRQLKTGLNVVEGVVVYGGKRYSSSLLITLVQAGEYSRFEYGLSTSPDTPPESLETFFTFGDQLIGYDDAVVVLDDTWVKEQLHPTAGQYLWMRMMNSDGEWVIVRLTGEPGADAIDFSVTATPSSYQNSDRRISDIVITISVNTVNMNAGTLFAYSFGGSVPSGVFFDSSLPNVIRITPGVSPEYIDVNVTAGAPYNIERKIRITSIPAIDGASAYLGVSEVIPPAYPGRILDGDWIMYIGADGAYKYGHVYKLSGSSWNETTKLTDLIAVQDDANRIIEEKGDTIFAKVVFAQTILATEIAVSGKFIFQNDFSGFRSILEISPESGLVMKYGQASGRQPVIFNADFATGRIFFGEPNSTKSSPVKGFMYDPHEQTIVTNGDRIVIEADGSLTTDVFRVYPREAVVETMTISGSDSERFAAFHNLIPRMTDGFIIVYDSTDGEIWAEVEEYTIWSSDENYMTRVITISLGEDYIRKTMKQEIRSGKVVQITYAATGLGARNPIEFETEVWSDPRLILKNIRMLESGDDTVSGEVWRDKNGYLHMT